MTLKIGASVSMMFRELPLLDRFAAAADAGFDGVEIQFIDEGDAIAMARAARAARMPVVLVNLPLGDMMTGGDGLSGIPGREAAFVAAAVRGLAAAAELGAAFVHIGPSRVPAAEPRSNCLAAYSRNIETALAIADSIGLDATLLVEQSNPTDFPGALFATVDEAAAMVRQIGAPRFGLLFDLYHVAMTGGDIAAAWAAHGDLAPHVQFSDAPGRHEPGTGNLDIFTAIAAIQASGYAGWFGAEYRPAADTVGGLDWLAAWRASDIQNIGAQT